MANPTSDGRMIRKDISDSDKFAKLSPEAAVLFCTLIPHLNPFGKLNGGPGYIKEIVCPKIPYLTVENIPSLLIEIDIHTNVKWFKYDSRHWIHSLSFLSEHQKIDTKKLGKDKLPDYPDGSPRLVHDLNKTSPELVHHERESESEPEREREVAALSGQEPATTEPTALADHAWQTFRSTFPLRLGKFIDEDAVRDKWAKSPAMWNQWNSAARNYASSTEVKDGAIMNPMKFISGRWRDWEVAEEPTGHDPPFVADLSRLREIEQDEKIAAEVRRKIAAGELPPRTRPTWAQPKTA